MIYIGPNMHPCILATLENNFVTLAKKIYFIVQDLLQQDNQEYSRRTTQERKKPLSQ